MNIVDDFTPEHLAYWSDFDFQVRTFTSPAEIDVGIEPARALVTPPVAASDLGAPCVRVAWKPNEIDLAHLARGGTLWLSCWGGLPPHYLEVQPPDGETRPRALGFDDAEPGT